MYIRICSGKIEENIRDRVKEKSLTTVLKFAIVMNIRAVANYIYI